MRSKEVTHIAAETCFFFLSKHDFLMASEGAAGLTFTECLVFYPSAFLKME